MHYLDMQYIQYNTMYIPIYIYLSDWHSNCVDTLTRPPAKSWYCHDYCVDIKNDPICPRNTDWIFQHHTIYIAEQKILLVQFKGHIKKRLINPKEQPSVIVRCNNAYCTKYPYYFMFKNEKPTSPKQSHHNNLTQKSFLFWH